MMYEFERTTNAFNFVFEKNLKPKEIVLLKMPVVTPNKRGINDIGWLSDGDVKLYGTLSKNAESDTALWQEIQDYHEINKVVSALKIENTGDISCKIEIRAILN